MSAGTIARVEQQLKETYDGFMAREIKRLMLDCDHTGCSHRYVGDGKYRCLRCGYLVGEALKL
jgi:hypothetical protein